MIILKSDDIKISDSILIPDLIIVLKELSGRLIHLNMAWK